MVTKQEQLEWLARKYKTWPEQGSLTLRLSAFEVGKFAVVNAYIITRKEWQQERDRQEELKAMTMQMCNIKPLEREKMSDKPEVDDSWFTYCKLPPCSIPVELWVGGTFAYNCEFIAMRGNTYVVWNLDADKPDCADSLNSEFRPVRTEREKMQKQAAQDNSWHEHGELPPAGTVCEVHGNEWVETFIIGMDKEGYCVYTTGNQYVAYDGENDPSNFRPLRTEREKSIDEMADLIAKSVFGSAKCQAEKLYEAGYRKVKP